MKKKIILMAFYFLVIVPILLGVSYIATSQSAGTKWWDKFGIPEYGGTIVMRSNLFVPNLDPYSSFGSGFFAILLETLWRPSSTADRDAWPFTSVFVSPDFIEGGLAERWQMSDPQTLVVKLRQGMKWENKAPLNGREVVAEDVAFHYDRMLGNGHGFSVPSPINAGAISAVEKVSAIDKYTVQFKFKYPTTAGFMSILDQSAQNRIVPPEWVALGGPPPKASPASAGPPKGGPPGEGPPKGGPGGILPSGPLADWHNAVANGPWTLSNYVAGNSITYTKNPDYWGKDRRHPQNTIPYADTLQMLLISDIATALAALRSNKIDVTFGIDWQQARSIGKTNPELMQLVTPAGGQSIDMRIDTKPFNDVRVRKALQLAIDARSIAKSHFGGTVDGTPCGLFNPVFTDVGYGFAYKDWPQSLKDEYTYDPARAKQLLSDAGYPDGFKTELVAPVIGDQELMQIIKSQFMDIGVDMEIKILELTAWQPIAFTRKIMTMNWDPAGKNGSVNSVTGTVHYFESSYILNICNVHDPRYDELAAKFDHAATIDEAKRMTQELDRYTLENHFELMITPSVRYTIWQPYLKGYSGEYLGPGSNAFSWLANSWIDQDMKKSVKR